MRDGRFAGAPGASMVGVIRGQIITVRGIFSRAKRGVPHAEGKGELVMSYCPGCGRDLGDEAEAESWETCPYCGTSLRGKAKVTSAQPALAGVETRKVVLACVGVVVLSLLLLPSWNVAGAGSYGLLNLGEMWSALAGLLGGEGSTLLNTVEKIDAFVWSTAAFEMALLASLVLIRTGISYYRKPEDRGRAITVKSNFILVAATLLFMIFSMASASSTMEKVIASFSALSGYTGRGVVTLGLGVYVALAACVVAIYFLFRRKA